MKSKLLSLTLFLILSGSLWAQSSAQAERMQRREARRARQAAELAQSRAEMIKLVQDTSFVLEANTFIGPFGQESPVTSFQNYFAIIGDKVAITGILQNYKGTIEIADGEAVLLNETGVDDVLVENTPVKVIKNAQMYIMQGNKVYTIMGTQVK